MSNNHISKDEFILEFFGNFGRELGNPKQWFTDNPMEVIGFIEDCKTNKLPAFMSVQPRRAHYDVIGFEKIFFDFDYADKTFIKKLDGQIEREELTDKDKELILIERKNSLPSEVKRFISNLIEMNLTPLVIKTNKGYHVYIYFDTVYEIDKDIKFWCEVYGTLYRSFYKDGSNHRFIDTSSEDDIFRMSRIPFSIHEKSGIECIIVDENLNPEKIRGIGYYKLHGLRKKDLWQVIIKTRDMLIKKAIKEKLRQDFKKTQGSITYGKSGRVRPCFLRALEFKEMQHKMRLALLLEVWYKEGKHSREDLIDVFRVLNDFDEKKTADQVDWFLEHKVYDEFKPYGCETMIKENWCIQDKCSRYKYKK